MPPPRIIAAGATEALTRCCAFRKFLWTPSAPEIHDGFLYLYGWAARQCGVRLHGISLLPNHYHSNVTPTRANLPEFTQLAHRSTACFLQEALKAFGHGKPPCVWDKRPTHYMRLMDVGASMEWALYLRLQAVAAGLVERPEDYPGLCTPLGLMKNGVVAVKRPRWAVTPDMPSELEVKFAPDPVLARGFGGDVQKAVHVLEKREREMVRRFAALRRRSGRSVLGPEVVKRVDPHAEPRGPRRRGSAPRYKVGGDVMESLGDLRQRRERLRDEQLGFREEHAASRARWRAGERDVAFPAGSYEIRVEHMANVAEPHDHAELCAPGEPFLPGKRSKRVADRSKVAALVDAVMDDLGLDDPLDVTSSPDASVGAAEEADDVEASDLESPPLTEGHPDMDRRADGGGRSGREPSKRDKPKKPS